MSQHRPLGSPQFYSSCFSYVYIVGIFFISHVYMIGIFPLINKSWNAFTKMGIISQYLKLSLG
jgi:hypothetical protein